MNDNNTIVYRHKKPCGEVFYVGIGCEKRPYIKSNRSEWWHNVVNKWGYEVEVVATGLNWEQACDLEELMILEYGRRDLATGTLVNMTAGGEGAKGRIPSKETRQKISATHKGKKLSTETRQKISDAGKGENNHNYGKKFSAEHRQKMSAALKGVNAPWYGKKHSAETRQKISDTNKGKLAPNRKLTFEQAEEIRQRYKTEKTSYNKLGQEYGVSGGTIYRIIHNKIYVKAE